MPSPPTARPAAIEVAFSVDLADNSIAAPDDTLEPTPDVVETAAESVATAKAPDPATTPPLPEIASAAAPFDSPKLWRARKVTAPPVLLMTAFAPNPAMIEGIRVTWATEATSAPPPIATPKTFASASIWDLASTVMSPLVLTSALAPISALTSGVTSTNAKFMLPAMAPTLTPK